MASKSNVSVVIDLGTSKITALAGQRTEEGKIEILGSAKVPSSGIKRGVILNIDEAAASIDRVLSNLGDLPDIKIQKVDIAYAGQPVKICEHRGYRFTSDEGVVSLSDVNELFSEAKNIKPDKDFKILHIIPQGFVIDEEIKEINPVGITGRKIEAGYRLITVPEIHLANIERVMDKAGVKTGDIVFSPLATSDAVLTDDEKEMGVILLDMGAGTTKVSVYNEGILIHTAVVPFGGDVISKDIKEGCSILPKWAEQLKVQYGEALGDFADDQKIVTIPGHSGWEPKEISFKSLAFIIQARLEEIIDNVYYHIEKSGIADQIGSGIVITGGTGKMQNLVSLVKFRTGMDARLAFPVIRPAGVDKDFSFSDFYTALGLLKMSLEEKDPVPKEKRKRVKKKKEGGFSPWLKNVVQGVLDYVDDDEDVALN
ncbi:MAG: cell division protein FtsA [Prolixibacteraceae bacterium]|jgi:cell division protein FtsA|nr:cell division protein FtsA [Prolixibacteraceae bacterium]